MRGAVKIGVQGVVAVTGIARTLLAANMFQTRRLGTPHARPTGYRSEFSVAPGSARIAGQRAGCAARTVAETVTSPATASGRSVPS